MSGEDDVTGAAGEIGTADGRDGGEGVEDAPERAARRQLALTTLLVRSYDEGIGFFVDTLGFELVEDAPRADADGEYRSKRWVVVAPSAGAGAALLLAEPANEAQAARVGDQTGGRVSMFLYTDDFHRDHARYRARGVTFVRGEPREEPYGTIAVFEDVSGNLWDLIEPRRVEPARATP